MSIEETPVPGRMTFGDVLDPAEDEKRGELVPYQPRTPTTLWSDDPKIALQRMAEVADALMDVVRSRGLSVKIRGREFLTLEAWVTLGALKGVHSSIVWTKETAAGDGIIARAEARTLDGALVGAAESECSRVEARWKRAEPYQIRSMASTRALSRSLQGPLRHIAVLGGCEGGAAEEVPAEEISEATVSVPADTSSAGDAGGIPPERRPTPRADGGGSASC